jgi:hypothetical protein
MKHDYPDGFYHLYSPGEEEPVLVQCYETDNLPDYRKADHPIRGFGYNTHDGAAFMPLSDLRDDCKVVPVSIAEEGSTVFASHETHRLWQDVVEWVVEASAAYKESKRAETTPFVSSSKKFWVCPKCARPADMLEVLRQDWTATPVEKDPADTVFRVLTKALLAADHYLADDPDYPVGYGMLEQAIKKALRILGEKL